MKTIALCLAFVAALTVADAQTRNVFCFYGSWAMYRTGNAKFDPEHIDVNRCTHVTYSFLGLQEDGQVRILDPWLDQSLGGFRRTLDLRNRNRNVKILVSMGGWSEGSERYSRVVNDPRRRATLVRSVNDFVRSWNFDGFDFDWEYPAQRGGSPNDYRTYIDFLRELRAAFGNRYLITAAVGASASYIGTSYNVPAMNQVLDFVNLMTYDFSGSWAGQTGHNSPLYNNNGLDIHSAVQNWIRHGTSRNKLFLGLAFYGQSFTLSNNNNNGVGAPISGPGNAGPWSQARGLLMYSEICQMIRNGGWNVRYDNHRQSPYMFRGNQWVGYDNPDSIRLKTRYAVDNRLGGVMMWSVDYEDHRNVCGGGANPLLRAIRDVIRT